MDKDTEQYRVAFHDRARESFFGLYKEFQHSVAQIDRRRDENLFQQLHGRYVNRLKHQLQSIALDLLTKADPGTDRGKMNRTLTSLMENYVQEFMQKVRSL